MDKSGFSAPLVAVSSSSSSHEEGKSGQRKSSEGEEETIDEDDDDPSSSTSSSSSIDNSSEEEEKNVDQTLDNFRQTWKIELKEKRKRTEGSSKRFPKMIPRPDPNQMGSKKSIEKEARYLFEEGILLERRGKLYDAVACYRRATQLVPDIEFKIFKREQQKESTHGSVSFVPETMDTNHRYKRSVNANGDKKGEAVEEEDLVVKFNRLNVDEEGNFYLCQKEFNQQETHFSALPYEVVIYILKWVVSDHLDLRSLEQTAMSCRGLYLAARDAGLWRSACIQAWGGNDIDSTLLSSFGNDWRKMFIERLRINFNGAYISRTTYVRHGESSFQDANYKPCYLVEYYRYLRFFPEGAVSMLTTSEDPYSSLPKLRFKKPRHAVVLTGHYSLSGSSVTAVFKRIICDEERPSSSRRNRLQSLMALKTSEQTFRLQLEMRASKGRNSSHLVWSHYSVEVRRNGGQPTISTFDLSPNKFPPFWFSRVKSYSALSESPLM